MTEYNVRISVVDLIDADSRESAIGTLRQRLMDAGFEPFEDTDDQPNAFESDTN